MELNRKNLINIFNALLDHFQYSINDIDSYEELTEKEKEIISKEVFDFLTRQ